jgi:hypothetical protein
VRLTECQIPTSSVQPEQELMKLLCYYFHFLGTTTRLLSPQLQKMLEMSVNATLSDHNWSLHRACKSQDTAALSQDVGAADMIFDEIVDTGMLEEISESVTPCLVEGGVLDRTGKRDWMGSVCPEYGSMVLDAKASANRIWQPGESSL